MMPHPLSEGVTQYLSTRSKGEEKLSPIFSFSCTCTVSSRNWRIRKWRFSQIGGYHLGSPSHNWRTNFSQIGGFLSQNWLIFAQKYNFGTKLTISKHHYYKNAKNWYSQLMKFQSVIDWKSLTLINLIFAFNWNTINGVFYSWKTQKKWTFEFPLVPNWYFTTIYYSHKWRISQMAVFSLVPKSAIFENLLYSENKSKLHNFVLIWNINISHL